MVFYKGVQFHTVHGILSGDQNKMTIVAFPH